MVREAVGVARVRGDARDAARFEVLDAGDAGVEFAEEGVRGWLVEGVVEGADGGEAAVGVAFCLERWGRRDVWVLRGFLGVVDVVGCGRCHDVKIALRCYSLGCCTGYFDRLGCGIAGHGIDDERWTAKCSGVDSLDPNDEQRRLEKGSKQKRTKSRVQLLSRHCL